MFLNEREKVASRAQIKDQIQVVFGLEGRVQFDDERVWVPVEPTEDVPFANYLLDSVHVSVGELLVVHVAHRVLFLHHYLAFVNDLHRVETARDLASGEHHFGEGSFTKDFDQFVILNALPLL